MFAAQVPNGALTGAGVIWAAFLTEGEGRERSDLSGGGDRRLPAVRGLRRAAAARLTMLTILLYGAGGVAIAVYMLAALIRPEKF
jgi:hypothetical protein